MNIDYLNVIDDKEKMLVSVSDYIWEHPETSYAEYKCAEYLCNVLHEEGFFVETGLAGIPTAFSGSFGSGRPVIGVLGEYDALCNLNQQAGVTYKSGDAKGNGHGCGHNLIAGSSIGAAIAVKEYLRLNAVSGTIVYFGCPAEEYGSGKAFLARDGVFDNLDAALGMHPDTVTGVRARTTLANCEILYKFDGVAAHASTQPQLGRSALDAVELMNIGANYLREHIVDRARVHYAITDAGGILPNVVQAHAEVLYLIRATDMKQVSEICERVDNIAQGAALMTGTSVTPEFVKACSNTVLNNTIQKILYEKMAEIGVPKATEADLSYAHAMTKEALSDFPSADKLHPLHSELEVYDGTVETGWGSTDVGDVSWLCPTAQIKAAMYAFGTPNHSWQQTAQGKTEWAHKMMLYVSKALAATAIELINNPSLVQEAKAEHRLRIDGQECGFAIPANVKPPIKDIKQ